jgi:Zn-dependent peptidase ImmA (M78 family)
MEDVNYRLLPIAREARGLTQSELVEKVPGLTQGNYSRMEKGTLAITQEIFHKVANALNFPVKFFYQPVPITTQEEYYYRKRLTMPRKHQVKLEANFDLLRIWIEALLTDVELPDFNLPPIEVAGNNTPLSIARHIRKIMNLPKGPIDKLVYSIEKYGIIVYFFKEAPEKFDGTTLVTRKGQLVIVINDCMSNDRKRFTIVHELGHIVMHLPYSPILDPDRDPEVEANQFASEFLMPELDVRNDLANLKFSGLGDLKQYWKVSKAAIIRRAYDLKYIDKTKYTTMMIELSRSGERKQEKRDVELDKPILLRQAIQTYRDNLGYNLDELLDLLTISKEDFETVLLSVEKNAKMKVVI